jgi:16S rRNA (uracil1498-N3)-methyltransferase
MTQLFLPHETRAGEPITLSGEDAHYLAHVLRRAPGDEFTVVTPAGLEAQVRITAISRTLVEGVVASLGPARPLPVAHVALYAALLKPKGWEWLLQKATEVGAAEIYPLLTAYSVVQPRSERLAAQVERWNKIAEAAGRQCQSPTVPVVHAPRELAEALRHWQAQEMPGLIFELTVRDQPEAHLRTVLSGLDRPARLALFIGPEGGFSEAAFESGPSAGLHAASLGPRILRAETAATVAVALCLHELSAPGGTP